MSKVVSFSDLNIGDTFENDENNYYIKGSHSPVSDYVNAFNITKNTFCKFGKFCPVRKVDIKMIITK